MGEKNYEIILYNCFVDPMGQAALEVMGELAFANETTYVQGMDAAALAFNEGRRSLYLDIVRHIKTQEEQNGRGQHYLAADQHGDSDGPAAAGDATAADGDSAAADLPWWKRFGRGE